MRFKRILIHRCTLVLTGQKIGETEYGKPIYGELPVQDVPCRADQIKRRVSVDQYGVDFVTENILFLDADQQIPVNTKVRDIRDLKDRPVLDGVYTVEKAQPIYSKVRLHHYEITLQKESDSDG